VRNPRVIQAGGQCCGATTFSMSHQTNLTLDNRRTNLSSTTPSPSNNKTTAMYKLLMEVP